MAVAHYVGQVYEDPPLEEYLQSLYCSLWWHVPDSHAEIIPKYQHYSLSIYWTKGRVGLLQKESKKHILSFSTGPTGAIGLA